MSDTADTPVDEGTLESMGLQSADVRALVAYLGRTPTSDELSTLMAMWQTTAPDSRFHKWLGSLPREESPRHDYLYAGSHSDIASLREPPVKGCVDIARSMHWTVDPAVQPFLHTGDAIYMVGDISTLFLNSDYAQQYLHLASQPADELLPPTEAIAYYQLILQSLLDNQFILSLSAIGRGGIFGTLLSSGERHRIGFDILSYREARLDAFLFGEEPGRYIVSLPQEGEDAFLLKMDEARVHCCMLGKTTKGRILVDGFDFGDRALFVGKRGA